MGIEKGLFYFQSNPIDPLSQDARGRRALERELGDPVPEQLLDARALALQRPLREGAAQLGYYDWSYRHKDGNALHLPLHVRRHKPAFWGNLVLRRWRRMRCRGGYARIKASQAAVTGTRETVKGMFSLVCIRILDCMLCERGARTFRLVAGRGIGFEKLLQS